MQRMILVPVEQYARMVESYDKAIKELNEVKEQLEAINAQDDETNREIKIYDIMDKFKCDMDTEELLLQDMEEGDCPGCED